MREMQIDGGVFQVDLMNSSWVHGAIRTISHKYSYSVGLPKAIMWLKPSKEIQKKVSDAAREIVNFKQSRFARDGRDNWFCLPRAEILCSKSRQVWLGRYREDVIQADGNIVRTRPQIVLSTKKELPTRRLAARKLDEILSRKNDYSYQPTRIATIAEFAKRWCKEVVAQRKPSTVRSANSHLNLHIIPQLGKLRLDQMGPENQQLFVNNLHGASRKTVLNILSTLSSMPTTAEN